MLQSTHARKIQNLSSYFFLAKEEPPNRRYQLRRVYIHRMKRPTIRGWLNLHEVHDKQFRSIRYFLAGRQQLFFWRTQWLKHLLKRGQPRLASKSPLHLYVNTCLRSEACSLDERITLTMIDEYVTIWVCDRKLWSIVIVLKISLNVNMVTTVAVVSTCILRRGLLFCYDLAFIMIFFNYRMTHGIHQIFISI